MGQKQKGIRQKDDRTRQKNKRENIEKQDQNDSPEIPDMGGDIGINDLPLAVMGRYILILRYINTGCFTPSQLRKVISGRNKMYRCRNLSVSIYLCLSVCPSVCLSVCLSIDLPIHLSIDLSISYLYLFIYLLLISRSISMQLFIHLSISIIIQNSVSISVDLYRSIYLSIPRRCLGLLGTGAVEDKTSLWS